MRRLENLNMEGWLASHGIYCTAKWIKDGSLKRTWRLYNHCVPWTMDLANRLTELGFTDYKGEPFGMYSGNGGVFSVFARGHEEMLNS